MLHVRPTNMILGYLIAIVTTWFLIWLFFGMFLIYFGDS